MESTPPETATRIRCPRGIKRMAASANELMLAPAGVRGILRLDWLSRKFLIHDRSLVNKRGHYGRALPKVIGLDTVEHIFIGVMRSGKVIHRILDELKPRNADSVVGKV